MKQITIKGTAVDERFMPSYAHEGDAGLDLKATCSLTLKKGERALVGTGLRLALEEGTVGFVCPRSGLAVKHGLTVLNAPGVVDASYRGEIKVPLINLGDEEIHIKEGDRIAQLVVLPFVSIKILSLSQEEFKGKELVTSRGTGGFGSTGV
jgi:dUTP pyrophosphatase